MNTQEMKLTPAELQMIALKREQEALKQKEETLRKEADREKRIAAAVSRIEHKTAEDNSQCAAAQEFFKDFPLQNYSLTIEVRDETESVTDYNNGGKREILWSKTFTRRTAEIIHNGVYRIRVWFHQPTDKFGRRKSGGEYKMYISGPGLNYRDERRGYTKPKSVIAKIREVKDQIDYEAAAKSRELNSLEATMIKMKGKYPDALVNQATNDERIGNRYVSYPVVNITFTNGVCITYRVYGDGSLGRKNITFPNTIKDSWALMDAMSGVNFETQENKH